MFKSFLTLVACAIMALLAPGVARADSIELRFASFAPPGSVWANALAQQGVETTKKTADRVVFKDFDSGQLNDERDLVRKLTLGQLDAAVLSRTGLSLIDGSLSVLDLPAMFKSPEELDYVADKLWPYFQKKFASKGFLLADRSEFGFEYFLSKSKLEKLADFKTQKVWQPDDAVASALFKKIGLSGVPLGVPEVEGALTSGALDVCEASPYNAVIFKWSTKVKYMTTLPLKFAIAATVYSFKSYQKLSPNDIKILEGVGRVYAKKLRQAMRKSNNDAKASLARQGVTIVTTPQTTVTDFFTQSEQVWNELAGKLYTKEDLQVTLDARAEYRKKHP